MSKGKIYDLKEAREKAKAYCAYRDRSQVEVREKLFSYGLLPVVIDEIIVELIQDKFIDEERFARSFVRGKFTIKHWGRNKIKQALYRHDLSPYIMQKSFEEIDEDAYEQTLMMLIEKKSRMILDKNSFRRNGKIAQWLISRGFESELVWEKLKTFKAL